MLNKNAYCYGNDTDIYRGFSVGRGRYYPYKLNPIIQSAEFRKSLKTADYYLPLSPVVIISSKFW